uniref:Uncharacterized protein n=1 Tax=Mustela putorius furo TaxID=9669 RepID=M3XS01_MUSPF
MLCRSRHQSSGKRHKIPDMLHHQDTSALRGHGQEGPEEDLEEGELASGMRPSRRSTFSAAILRGTLANLPPLPPTSRGRLLESS